MPRTLSVMSATSSGAIEPATCQPGHTKASGFDAVLRSAAGDAAAAVAAAKAAPLGRAVVAKAALAVKDAPPEPGSGPQGETASGPAVTATPDTEPASLPQAGVAHAPQAEPGDDRFSLVHARKSPASAETSADVPAPEPAPLPAQAPAPAPAPAMAMAALPQPAPAAAPAAGPDLHPAVTPAGTEAAGPDLGPAITPAGAAAAGRDLGLAITPAGAGTAGRDLGLAVTPAGAAAAGRDLGPVAMPAGAAAAGLGLPPAATAALTAAVTAAVTTAGDATQPGSVDAVPQAASGLGDQGSGKVQSTTDSATDKGRTDRLGKPAQDPAAAAPIADPAVAATALAGLASAGAAVVSQAPQPGSGRAQPGAAAAGSQAVGRAAARAGLAGTAQAIDTPPGVPVAAGTAAPPPDAAIAARWQDSNPTVSAPGPQRREALPASGAATSAAAAPQTGPTPDLAALMPQVSVASTVQATGATASGPHASVADQILPSVVSLVHGSAAAGGLGHAASGRITISVAPEALGHVSITVERAADGTTSIQVSAERLATLELLRKDQGDLTRALDTAGISQNSHSLSFSWDGGGNGGSAAWAGSGEQRGSRRPPNSGQSYATDSVAAPLLATTAAARGGVDVTA